MKTRLGRRETAGRCSQRTGCEATATCNPGRQASESTHLPLHDLRLPGSRAVRQQMSASQWVVLCYGSPRKWIHPPSASPGEQAVTRAYLKPSLIHTAKLSRFPAGFCVSAKCKWWGLTSLLQLWRKDLFKFSFGWSVFISMHSEGRLIRKLPKGHLIPSPIRGRIWTWTED